MSLLPSMNQLHRAWQIFYNPVVPKIDDVKDYFAFEQDIRIAEVAKKFFKVIAILTAIGLGISLIFKATPIAYTCGFACLISLIAIRRFSGFALKASNEFYVGQLNNPLLKVVFGKDAITTDDIVEVGEHLKKFQNVDPKLKSRAIEKCWEAAGQQKSLKQYLNACEKCQNYFDPKYESSQAKLVDFQFSDKTLQVPHYYIQALANFKKVELPFTQEDQKVKFNVSWKNFFIELFPTNSLMDIPLFDPSKNTVDNFLGRIELLKEAKGLRIRNPIEEILIKPKQMSHEDFVAKLKEASVKFHTLSKDVDDSNFHLYKDLPLFVMNMAHSKVTDKGLQHMPVTLKSLVLPKGITDDGLKQCQRWTSLEKLFLCGEMITNAGIEHLVSLTLKSLNFFHTKVDEGALPTFQKMNQLNHLVFLGPKNGFDELKEKLGFKIEVNNPESINPYLYTDA